MRTRCLVRALARVQTRTGARFCSSAPLTPSTEALKNVTKSNFEAALCELRRHVRDADFVAIDLEMTGVTSAPWRESLAFDRPDVRYLKVKDSAEKFAVVQFGVCPFRWEPKNNSFVAHPHNFYIFPRQEISDDIQSYEFLCQTSSVDFLAKYQFDFNLCIREGISYLSRSQEEEALRHVNLTYKDELSDSASSTKGFADTQIFCIADTLFVERMKNKISEWRNGLLKEDRCKGPDSLGSLDETNRKFSTIFFKMRPALVLNGLTSRQMRLVQSVTEKHFKDLAYIHVTAETSSSQPLIVYTDSTSDREMLMGEVKHGLREAAETKIKAAVGFRHVIDLLSSERKLIVGHNCFLDFAHIYKKFLGPLPSTAEEYVAAVRKYFPFIVDTKVLLNSDNILGPIMKKGSTSLSKAFASLCPQIASVIKMADRQHVKVEVQVDDKSFSHWNSGAKHEAGYDAFMTGCVFAQACSHLGIDFELQKPPIDLRHNEKLHKYMNHLYLSWINGDIIDLSTGKCTADKLQYPKILFPNIVILWGLPPKLKAREIRECICKALGADSVTSVYQLDVTAAFVQFSKEELVSKFLELKDSLEKNNDPISVIHPLSKILEGRCTKAARYEIYKQVCSSPVSEILFADQAAAVGITGETRLFEPMTEVEMQENRTLGEESGVDAFPNSQYGEKIASADGTGDAPSSDHFSSDEVLDSFYPVEAQMSK